MLFVVNGSNQKKDRHEGHREKAVQICTLGCVRMRSDVKKNQTRPYKITHENTQFFSHLYVFHIPDTIKTGNLQSSGTGHTFRSVSWTFSVV